jgi:hypothetical protein
MERHPTQFQASVQADSDVTIETAGVMTPSGTTLEINVPDNPALSKLINQLLVPELVGMINTSLEPASIVQGL